MSASTSASPVLLQRRPVLFDAVEAVQRSLDLAHQGHAGDERGDPHDDQHRVLARRARRVGVEDGVGQRLPRGARYRFDDGTHDGRAQVGVAERGRDSDEDDESLHQQERRDERQRPRVAEAVGGTEADERVTHQLLPPRAAERLTRLVAAELPGLGDEPRCAHAASSGTQIVTAAGSTLILRRSTGFSSPPSSS